MEYVNEQWQEALVRYLVNESSAAEIKEVEQWLDESPDNRAFFGQLRKIWEQSRQLTPALTTHENDAWERFMERVNSSGDSGAIGNQSRTGDVPGNQVSEQESELKPAPVRRLGWLRIAALFILVAGAGWLGWNLLLNDKLIIARAGDQVLHYSFPDGSTAVLNRQAVISYAKGFRGNSRKMELKGEAFFDVVADAQKPFIVKVGDIEIRVLGTSFNVRSDHTMTEVVVETGTVSVTKNDQHVTVKEKEKLIIQAGEMLPEKEAVENKLYNYYRSDRFVCEATPLRELVATLNEAFNVHIVIEDEKLGDLPLTSSFSTESLDPILEIISQTFNIRVIKTNDRILLK